jgi:putative redox protein
VSTLSLVWKGALQFVNAEHSPPIELHSSTPGFVSPTQALAYSVMACMGMDVVHVLQKGKYDLRAMRVTFDSTRAESHPRRYTSIHLHFDVTGDIPDKAVARAIELSRTTYCSVSNSLRQDILFKTTFSVHEI